MTNFQRRAIRVNVKIKVKVNGSSMNLVKVGIISIAKYIILHGVTNMHLLYYYLHIQ
jgi:hypothetical protein